VEVAPDSTVIGVVIACLALIGLIVTVWVFWPAFQGPEAARRLIGTHRLAIGSVVAVIVLNTIITLPLVSVLHLDKGFTAFSFVVAALSTQVPMLLVIYVRLVMPGAVTWRELGLRPLSLGYVVRLGLGAGIAGVLISVFIEMLLSQVGLQPNQLEQFKFVLSEGPLAFAVLLFAAGVMAPLVEELFFRGFLFGLYRTRQPLWVAYLVSSVLFTLLHLEPTRMNLAQMSGLSIGIFLLAMLLAWLYQHSGSLYPGIVAHAVNNATGLILFYALAPLR
jgi:membrane protease YdiL (CAAX protease family)